MAQIPPPAVDELPPEPNSGNPVPFAGLMDTFLAALAPFRSGMIALGTNCYNNAVDACNSAVSAAASLAGVIAAGGATEWISGTTYSYGTVVWSPIDFLSYRRKVTGGGTTDPSLDPGNWASLNVLMDTSVTSNSIDTGPKSFTVSTGKGFRGGMYLVIADTAAPSTNSMFAQITSYNSGSGALVVRVITVLGSGTHSDWTISQSSAGGAGVRDLMGRNLIVNGSCQIDQVNTGALITPTDGSYPIDNFMFNASAASKLQTQQVTNALNSLGATHACKISVLASYTPGSTESFTGRFPIEGLDFAHLQWGTANAKAASLQFKINASVAGTYSGAIQNAAANRSYPFSFTLIANTDTVIKIEAIPGDTSGTWPSTNVTEAYVTFDLGSGSGKQGPANAWAGSTYNGVTGSANLVAQSNGSSLSVTDVQLEEGNVCTTYGRKIHDAALRECQRYFNKFSYSATAWIVGVTGVRFGYTFPIMRVSPTLVADYGSSVNYGPGGNTSLSSPTPNLITATGMEITCTNVGGGMTTNYGATVYGIHGLSARI